MCDNVLTENQRTRHLLWLMLYIDVHRYLVCNSAGQLDGNEKYNRHKHMDGVIGFPIIGNPNYEQLAPLFFNKFIDLCDQVKLI